VAGSSAQDIVPRTFAAISLRSAGSQTRTVSARASATSAVIAPGWEQDVSTVIACHDHQLKTSVLAIGVGNPIRVGDLDATRFLARSRHVPSVKTWGVANIDNE
jgi:hypothetical protein